MPRRGVRVVEGARLESVCWGNSTVGSNPTLSAISQVPCTEVLLLSRVLPSPPIYAECTLTGSNQQRLRWPVSYSSNLHQATGTARRLRGESNSCPLLPSRGLCRSEVQLRYARRAQRSCCQ